MTQLTKWGGVQSRKLIYMAKRYEVEYPIVIIKIR